MKKPRTAPRSVRPAQNEMPKLTQEEVAVLRAQEARRRQPRFPLDLVATLAAQFVTSDASGATDRAPYAAAAQQAIMLLDACQEELLRDANKRAVEEIMAAQNALIAAKQKERERLCQNGVASFTKGLLHITGQKSLTQAQPLFKRWRHGLREHPDVFPHLVHDMGPVYVATVVLEELAEYREEGFDLATLEQFRAGFITWYEEFEKPSLRARAGRTGGSKPRRKKS